ncbi:hypothetical protein GSI_00702 [Ganoderma sinense ZZ0214-1]|uniref:Uncharacterized protein n=1 Tax=Ganoderma sinense ZZ0214-1 TaxID=1077348 RepID=A0A2G8STB9_9APHY|nr:hypothetical protein GSI_00702 [Ganoderma sinense ZZ0214-1]
MSSSHNTGQSLSSDDTAVVQNFPVHAESVLSGALPSAPGDLPGDCVPADVARAGCPHRSTQTNEDLNRAAGDQLTPSRDNQATVSRGPTTDEQILQRGLNPGSAGHDRSNAFRLRQQRPAATAPRASSSQTEIEASAQQQASSGTSSAYPAHLHLPNSSVASMAPAFDRVSWLQELHMEYLTTQYTVKGGPHENVVDRYEQYYNVR